MGGCVHAFLEEEVFVKKEGPRQVLTIKWRASPMADLIADSVLVVALELTRAPEKAVALLQTSSSSSSSSATSAQAQGRGGGRKTAGMQAVENTAEQRLWTVWSSYLAQTFGELQLDAGKRSINFTVDEKFVVVEFNERSILCADESGKTNAQTEAIRKKIGDSLRDCEKALKPVPKFYST